MGVPETPKSVGQPTSASHDTEKVVMKYLDSSRMTKSGGCNVMGSDFYSCTRSHIYSSQYSNMH